MGWQWVHQIARFHQTWVLTRSNNRRAIEEALKQNPNPNLKFVYLDLPSWARFWKKGNRGVHLYYYIWQILSGITARKLHSAIGFDLAHHVTFVNDWIGTGLSLVSCPLVWGPIGSNPNVSRKYVDFIGRRELCRRYFRSLFRKLMPLVDPMHRLSMKRAALILPANRESLQRISKEYRQKTLAWPQNAISREVIAKKHKRHTKKTKIISIGQLRGIKGFRLAIKAFSLHTKVHPASTLTIVGEGKQRQELEALCADMDIERKVIFTGEIPRQQVFQALDEHSVFLFPSFEGAGMVVIEAMARGLPVVCLDFGGPGEYVTEDCGIKVPLTELDEVVAGLADALNRLASDSALYERLSAGAIARVRDHFTWDYIGDRLNEIYQQVLKST
ncbi:MAG: glycosyltransferase family 4 protein [Candidatus Parvarchaeota archaeon]|nr:glycosyltransferase family 4 protein [Candidatus Jingweiarchaeum tengchongense]